MKINGRLGFFGLAVATIATGACTSRQQAQFMRTAMARLLPNDVDAFSKGYLKLIQGGRLDSAATLLVPSLQSPAAATELRKIASILNRLPVDSGEVVGVNVFNSGSVVHTNVTYQLHVDTTWAISNVAVVESPGGYRVEGVSARPLKESLAVINAFSFSGKPPVHYVFVALGVLVVCFNVVVALLAIRSRIALRWLWALLALVGFGRFVLNWTTGQYAFQPVDIQLFGVGFLRAGLYAPWLVSFSLPIGAVLVLEKLRRAAKAGPGVPAGPAPTVGSGTAGP